MASTQEVKKRRKQVKKYLIRGIPMKKIADQFDVSYSTIKRDKKAIKDELKEDLAEEPIEEALFELDATLDAVTQEYWKIYTAKVKDEDGNKQPKHNINARMGALKHIKDAIFQKIKILQRLGIIREEPLKIESEIENNNVEKALDMLESEIHSDDEGEHEFDDPLDSNEGEDEEE